jgi:hypothetical protein
LSSTAQRVRSLVLADNVTRIALARGIVSLRALARWLIRQHRLVATEAAVHSALRRIAQEDLGS